VYRQEVKVCLYPLCTVRSYMGSGVISPPIINISDGGEW
jgi:hypothetical protein